MTYNLQALTETAHTEDTMPVGRILEAKRGKTQGTYRVIGISKAGIVYVENAKSTSGTVYSVDFDGDSAKIETIRNTHDPDLIAWGLGYWKGNAQLSQKLRNHFLENAQ